MYNSLALPAAKNGQHRPMMPHNNTTPDLHVSQSSSQKPIDQPSGRRYRLLQDLTTLNELYETVVFDKKKRINSAEKDYNQSISFDDIDSNYNDQDVEEDQSYSWEYEFGGRGRNLARSRLPMGRTSPSPTGFLNPPASLSRVLSPGPRIDYPTRPIVTSKGCSFVREHKDYRKLYKAKISRKVKDPITHKEKVETLKPALPYRVILVYISGRKHTWVALDWILNKYIENGDTVIVIAAIKDFSPTELRKKSIEPQRGVAISEDRRNKQRHRPERVKEVALNIMDYMLRILKPNTIAKLKVELSIGRTKEVLKQMYILHEPNIVCTGSKSNLRTGAPLKSWNSLKVSDRLVKNFPLPLIVVPAVNMDIFESHLGSSLGDMTPLPKFKGILVDDEEKEGEEEEEEESGDSESDTALILSLISNESEDSIGSYDEIAKLYINYKKSVSEEIERLKKRPRNNEEYFQAFIAMISDKSIQFCVDVDNVDPDFKGKGARLARAITGSNKFGSVPFKTKSLLPPIEKPKLGDGLDKTNTSGMSYKEMKRMLLDKQRANEEGSIPSSREATSPPTVTIETTSPSPTNSSEPPSKRNIKFVNLETPNQNARHYSESNASNTKKLMKSLSHEVDSRSVRPVLEPRKSHPDMELKDSLDDRTKKKRGSFWKLFK